MFEVSGTFLGCDVTERIADFKPELVEDLLDGIEIGAVGRQITEVRTLRFYSLANACEFVGGQLVHDDDIARLENGRQELLGPGLEGKVSPSIGLPSGALGQQSLPDGATDAVERPLLWRSRCLGDVTYGWLVASWTAEDAAARRLTESLSAASSDSNLALVSASSVSAAKSLASVAASLWVCF